MMQCKILVKNQLFVRCIMGTRFWIDVAGYVAHKKLTSWRVVYPEKRVTARSR